MQFWAVMPAAGRGERMRTGDVPKQYLPLAGRRVIEWSMSAILARMECRALVVALHPNDDTFASLALSRESRVRSVTGGQDRAGSVRAGLDTLLTDAKTDDWVLVHDAARPCVSDHELTSLLSELQSDPVGGLLARPVVDTLKRSEAGRVQATVPRAHLWRALTPQMFRFGLLRDALMQSGEHAITDEAQAIEMLGLQAKLVMGHEDNIKITYPDDLARAERVLQSRQVKA